MKLNISHFKKISDEKDHAILKHPAGHEFKVAKKGLSPANLKELNALPIHKYADGTPPGQTVAANDSYTPFEQGVQNLGKKMGMSSLDETSQKVELPQRKPGNVATSDDQTIWNNRKPVVMPSGPTEVEDDDKDDAIAPPQSAKGDVSAPAPRQPLDPNQFAQGGKVKQYAEGDMVLPINTDAASQMAPVPAALQQSQGNLIPDAQPEPGSQPYGTPEPAPKAAQPSEAPQMAPQPIDGGYSTQQAPAVQKGQDVQAVVNPDMQDPAKLMQSGYDLQKTGIREQAAAQASMAKGQAQALDPAIQKQQQALDDYHGTVKDLTDDYNNFMDDIKNQHIDPNHYLNSMDVGSKVKTGIGLILGGIGAGLTHGPNLAMDFLNKQIDRDIGAQQANLGKSQSLLSANLKQFGNMKDAVDMTRLMSAGIIENQLKDAAAKAGTAQAKANADQAIGQLQQQYAPQAQQFMMRQAFIRNANNPGGGDPVAMANLARNMGMKDFADNLQAKIVPGIGPGGRSVVADIPVPEPVRDKITATKNLINMTNTMKQWMAKNGASLDPRIVQQGLLLHTELKQAYKQGMQVPGNEEEGKAIDAAFGTNPSGFLQSRTIPKALEALQSSAQARLQNQAQMYGIRGLDTGPSGESAQAAQAPQIKIVNGVKYMRGPDGKAVRMK